MVRKVLHKGVAQFLSESGSIEFTVLSDAGVVSTSVEYESGVWTGPEESNVSVLS